MTSRNSTAGHYTELDTTLVAFQVTNPSTNSALMNAASNFRGNELSDER